MCQAGGGPRIFHSQYYNTQYYNAPLVRLDSRDDLRVCRRSSAHVKFFPPPFQSVAHGLSSVCCLTRFWKESRWGKYGARDGRKGDEDDEEEEATLLMERKVDLSREQILSVAIGMIMLLSSVALMFKAGRKFRFWNKW